MPNLVIEADGLTKSYGPRRGIEDVTFAVEEGRAFGFLGPNGAGKTTTIRVLLGFLRATGGSARLFGEDAFEMAPSLHANVAYLGSDPGFLGELTGAEQLDYLAKLRGLPRRAWARLAERLELDPTVRIRRLSRGNRQKIGVVAAFMGTEPLLILDEPTNGLDPLMQREFLALLADAREEGRTVFLSSHNLVEVERACDEVAIIRDGRIAEITNVTTLLSSHWRSINLVLAKPARCRRLRPSQRRGGRPHRSRGPPDGPRRHQPAARPDRRPRGCRHRDHDSGRRGPVPPPVPRTRQSRGPRGGVRMTALRMELRRNRSLTLWLAIAMGAYGAVMGAMYPFMVENDALFTSYMEAFPQEMLAAFGMTGSLSDPGVFFTTYIGSWLWPIMAAVVAMLLGTRVAVDLDRGFLDLPLATPVSRVRYLTGSIVGQAVAMALVATATVGALWVVGVLVGADFDPTRFALGTGSHGSSGAPSPASRPCSRSSP